LWLGIARAGNSNPLLKADFIGLANFDFGEPPTASSFQELHFMEAEALMAFGAHQQRLGGLLNKFRGAFPSTFLWLKRSSANSTQQIPINVTEDSGGRSGLGTDYLEDAKYYKAQGKLETSLTSVAYCEGRHT
jgi:hypothetical protein